MFDMRKLPFPVALDNDSLMRNIAEFDSEKYERDVKVFMKRVGNEEDGKASGRVVELIRKGKV